MVINDDGTSQYSRTSARPQLTPKLTIFLEVLRLRIKELENRSGVYISYTSYLLYGNRFFSSRLLVALENTNENYFSGIYGLHT